MVNSWGQEFDAESIYKDEELSLIAQLESMKTTTSTPWVEAKQSPAADVLQSEEAMVEEDAGESSSSEGEDMDEDPSAQDGASGTHRQNKILYSHEGVVNPKLARSQEEGQEAKKARRP